MINLSKFKLLLPNQNGVLFVLCCCVIFAKKGNTFGIFTTVFIDWANFGNSYYLTIQIFIFYQSKARFLQISAKHVYGCFMFVKCSSKYAAMFGGIQ